MLNVASGTKIFLYAHATDMRKGFVGLSAIIREEFNADPTDGSLFIFINRRRDRMKLLHFASGGFWLYYRLLEAGTFETTDWRSTPRSCRCCWPVFPLLKQTNVESDWPLERNNLRTFFKKGSLWYC